MAVADGFHVDSNGNLWLGSNRETFDATTRSEAPFYVYANGDMVANSGTFAGTLSSGISISAPVITGGSISGTSGSFTGSISGASGTFTGDLSGSDITGGTIDIGSGTFTVDSAGAMVATSATITGSITSTSGTIGGISINSGDIQANYSAGSSGFLIESDGDAFFNSVTVNNPIITLGTQSSGTPTSASSSAIKIGTSVIFEQSNKLKVTKPFVVLPDGSESAPSLTISGDYDELGFFVTNSTDFGGFSTFSASNGSDDIFSFNTLSTQFNVKGVLAVEGNGLIVNGDSGSNNQFIGKDSSGNLGYHTVATGSHNHDSSYASSSHSHSHNHDSDYYSSSAGSVLASSLSSHTGHATSLSILSNTSSNNSGGLFVTAVSGLGIQRTNIAGTTMDTQKVRPRVDQSYAIGESGRRYTVGYFQFGTSTSDERLKENIEELDLGLDFINKLQPKKYNWTTEIITDDDGEEIIKRGDIANIDMFGFMAQDVLAIDDLNDDITYGIARHDTEEDSYDLSYENMIAPLVKAVQELSAKNDELQSRIEELEG
tara:strand:+ start:4005 stop:5639 length:1635 start_codon:yes stop_codon:yes gene_type:complete